jgi:hypothetical protein
MIDMNGPKTLWTDEYHRFKQFEFNRDITRLTKLINCMKKYGYDEGCPIHCRQEPRPDWDGKDLIIIQGHHRFEASMLLGIPLCYLISKSTTPVYELELANHSWNTNDYITGYAKQGRPDYKQLKFYHEQTGIPLTTALSLFSGHIVKDGGGVGPKAKKGNFIIKNAQLAEDIAGLTEHAKNLGVACATNRCFVVALAKARMAESWDDERWMKKLETYSSLLEKHPDVESYLKNIETVFNRQCKAEDKAPIAWQANIEAQKRNVNKKYSNNPRLCAAHFKKRNQ